jgi:hypothetical protein
VVLYRPADTDPNKARASLLAHHHLTGPAARLRTVAIDDVTSDPVTLIKIDVEGHETEVVLGARRTIAEHSPAIVWEYAPELRAAGSVSPFGWLAERGYKLFDIQPYRHRVTGRNQLRLAPLAELPKTGTNILAATPPMAARIWAGSPRSRSGGLVTMMAESGLALLSRPGAHDDDLYSPEAW